MNQQIFKVIEELAQQLVKKQLMLVTAESCTGGLLSMLCTSIPGSSRWFERGFVTYSNAAKTECLSVSPDTIQTHGAVSAQTAEAMARGSLEKSPAQLSIAITGVAGPDGGTVINPVGSVWFGFGLSSGEILTSHEQFNGDRQVIRESAACHALSRLLDLMKGF